MNSIIIKVFLIISFLFSAAMCAKPSKITLTYQNTNNYPFQTGNSNTINWNKPGTLVEMFKIVEQKLGVEIEFKRVPWKRALFNLKNGKTDGLFEASFKQKRLEFGQYPLKNGKIDERRRTNYNSYYLYKRKNSKLTWNGKTFSNLNNWVCAEREYSIVDDLRKMQVEVHEFNNTTKCLELLYNDRVNAVAALELAADSILNKKSNNLINIVKVKPALKTKIYHLMLSHQFVNKYPEFSEILWDTVAQVRESKEMKVINKKYY